MTVFLLNKWEQEGKLNGNQFLGSTIVSTPMMEKIANHYGVHYKEGLTGFKWIAKMIVDYPELEFICGGEESFGFMVGDHVRDKDAVSASLLICEMAAKAKTKGTTLYNELLQHYQTFGFFKDKLLSLTKQGVNGLKEIQALLIIF
jgi:phosphoglucomutase